MLSASTQLRSFMASYPAPKKAKLAHQNFTGNITHNKINNSNIHKHTKMNNNNTAQNKWLRENVMDGHGNYLFCLECIVASLGVHTERLHKQRVIKQKQEHEPILQMTKQEVMQKRLEDHVLHDDESAHTFSAWWKELDDDEVVEVQFPHERHGLAGR